MAENIFERQEKLLQEERNVFLKKYDVPVRTDLQRADEIEYATDTQILNKPKENYFAMMDFEEPTENIAERALKEIPFKSLALSSPITAGAYLSYKASKTPVMRGLFATGISTIRQGGAYLVREAANGGLTPGLSTKPIKQVLDAFDADTPLQDYWNTKQKMVDDFNGKVKIVVDNFLERSGLAKTEEDGFWYDLGGAAGSILTSIGLLAATRNPLIGAMIFGAAEGQGTYEEAIAAGVTPEKAANLGRANAAWIGMTEVIGDKFFGKLLYGKGIMGKFSKKVLDKVKKGKTPIVQGLTATAAGFVKGGSIESIQEASQNVGSDVISLIGGISEKTAGEIVGDALYAGLLAALLGSGPGGIATYANFRKFTENVSATLQDAGMDKDVADKIGREVALTATGKEMVEESLKAVSSEINSPLTAEDRDPQKFARVLTEAQTREIEQESWNVEERVREQGIAAGVAPEVAEASGKVAQTLVNNIYTLAKITPSEQKNFKIGVINGSAQQEAQQETTQAQPEVISADNVQQMPLRTVTYTNSAPLQNGTERNTGVTVTRTYDSVAGNVTTFSYKMEMKSRKGFYAEKDNSAREKNQLPQFLISNTKEEQEFLEKFDDIRIKSIKIVENPNHAYGQGSNYAIIEFHGTGGSKKEGTFFSMETTVIGQPTQALYDRLNNDIAKSTPTDQKNLNTSVLKGNQDEIDRFVNSLSKEEQVASASALSGDLEFNAVSFEDEQQMQYSLEQAKEYSEITGFSLEQIQSIYDFAKTLINKAMKMGKMNKHDAFVAWNEFRPDVFIDDITQLALPLSSVFKKNGDFPVNYDFGTLCIKREALDFLIRHIVNNPDLVKNVQNMGVTQMDLMKYVLKENGYITACDVCFVEGKRLRQLIYANSLSYEWESVRQAIGLKDNKMVGQEIKLTAKQVKILEEMADNKTFKQAFEKYMPEERRRLKRGETVLDSGITADKMQSIAELFLLDQSLAGQFNPNWLLSSAGVDWLKKRFTVNTKGRISSFLSGVYGSATPKPIESQAPYVGTSFVEIDMNEERDKFRSRKQRKSLIEKLFNIGAARLQSFSDFNAMLTIDNLQLFMDCTLRGIPLQVYTKEPAFVKLFAETGANINMSFVPNVGENSDETNAGLKAATQEQIDAYNQAKAKGDEYLKEQIVNRQIENVYTDEDGVSWVYDWSEDSFPIEEAYKLRRESKGNVGIIGVGISDKHILMMLNDPAIDMIIPFHSSGMPTHTKVVTGLGQRTADYEKVQTTKGLKEGVKDFSFNEDLQHVTKDAKKSAENYKKFCKDNGATPKYPQFKDHENYYKVLEDFRSYDNEGKPVIQKAVNILNINQDNFLKNLHEALGVREEQLNKMANLPQDTKTLDKLKEIFKPQRADGATREAIEKRLQKVLGKDNVQILEQRKFFDALREEMSKDVGAKEAEKRVEVFRDSGKYVYGFAKDGKIFLNETTFNAETPAHEFTHIWVKVARAYNPKRWKEGVKLLKKTTQWEDVMNDPLYANIRGDEDAVASEVLARIVGIENGKIINKVLDPKYKEPKEVSTAVQKVLEWFRKLWEDVRDFFDLKDGDAKLTYDEFVMMPLRDLWDDSRSSNFKKKLKNLREKKAMDGEGEMQSGFHGSPHQLQGGKISLSYVGTGARAQAHGYGVYVAKQKEAGINYRTIRNGGQIFYKGKPINELMHNLLITKQYNRAALVEDFVIKMDHEALDKDYYSAEDWKWFEEEILPDIKQEGFLAEVEIPENDSLIGEDGNFNSQSDHVKKAIKKGIAELERDNLAVDDEGLFDDAISALKWWSDKDTDADGYAFYEALSSAFGGNKEASEFLDSIGIKGIRYFDEGDGEAFVIFNDKDVKIKKTFYQNGRGSVTIDGDAYEAIIRVFENSDPSTIIHELAHIYLTMINNAAKVSMDPEFQKLVSDINAWLGEPAGENGAYSEEQQEMFARAFEGYMAEGKSPNKEMEGIFEKFAKWLAEVYESVKDYLQITPEVRSIFDRLLTTEEPVKKSKYIGQVERAKELMESIKTGIKNEDSLELGEMKALLKTSSMRRPAEPKNNLLKDLKKHGADYGNAARIDKEAYKNAGVKEAKDGIDDKPDLWLQKMGYMDFEESTEETVEQAWKMIEDALDGKKVYRLEDQDRASQLEAYDENLKLLQEIFPDFMGVADTRRMISELERKGYRVVEKKDITNLEKALDRLTAKKESELDKDLLPAAKKVRNAVIAELEKRQLAGKDQMVALLKSAKTTDEITSAVEGILDQVTSAWEETEEGKQEKRRANLPSTDWDKKHTQLLAKINDIVKKTDATVVEAQKRLSSFLGRILSEEEAKEKERAERIVRNSNLEGQIIKAMMETVRGEAHVDSKDINKIVARLAHSLQRNRLISKYSVDEFIDSVRKIQETNYKKYMIEKIQDLLRMNLFDRKGSLKKAMFDPETMNALSEMKRAMNLSPEQAAEELNARMQMFVEKPASQADRIVNEILSIVANDIKDISTTLCKQTYDDVYELRKAGKSRMNLEKMIKDFRTETDKKNVLSAIKKNKKAGVVKKMYASWLANWESILDLCTNKETKEEYSMLNLEADSFTHQWQRRTEIMNGVRDIYRLGRNKDVYGKMNELLEEKHVFMNYFHVDRNPDPAAIKKTGEAFEEELNKMQIITLYIWSKNDILADRLAHQYGWEQLKQMFFEILDANDRKLGDFLQQEAEKSYNEINAVFVKERGYDLPKVQAYFPSITERVESELDFLQAAAGSSQNPYFTKARASSAKIEMKPENPFGILFRHIERASDYHYKAEKMNRIRRVFKSTVIKHPFIKQFGEDVYNRMLEMIDQFSVTKPRINYDMDKLGDWLTNNYVKGAIALKPTVGLKQLVSSVNYAENMPSHLWVKGFIEAWMHPKETVKFMKEGDPYLKARFESGSMNEALSRAIADAKAIGAGRKFVTLTDLLTLNTRLGDIGAICFGGKAYVDYLINVKGMSKADAFAEFRKATLRSQQSNTRSSLSTLQAKDMNFLMRALFAFKNTPAQYARKIADAIWEYQRGEISAAQLGKVVAIYALINSWLYNMLTTLGLLAYFNDDDESEEIIAAELFFGPFVQMAGCLPILDVAVSAVAEVIQAKCFDRKPRLKEPEIPTVAELFDLGKKALKEDIEGKDVMEMLASAGHLFGGLPAQYMKGFAIGTKDLVTGENPMRGFLMMLGYTERRARIATGTRED